jgi:hypothetical protein
MCPLRWGEITGLRRRDVEKEGSRIYITSQLIDLPGQGLIRGAEESNVSGGDSLPHSMDELR